MLKWCHPIIDIVTRVRMYQLTTPDAVDEDVNQQFIMYIFVQGSDMDATRYMDQSAECRSFSSSRQELIDVIQIHLYLYRIAQQNQL